MTVSPIRLLKLPFVQVFHQSSQLVMLRKTLDQSLENRQSFLSMHALSYIKTGIQRIEPYEGELIQVHAREIAILKKGLYTLTDLITSETKFEAYLLFFTDPLLEEVFNIHQGELPYKAEAQHSFILKAPEYLAHFWTSIEKIHSSLLNTSPTFFDIKAWELFSALISEDEQGKVGSRLRGLLQKKPGNLQAFMEDHFDKPLSIDDYAYLTGRSSATFRREFKLKFGSSPRKWIIQRRLNKATELLQKSKKSVAEIAREVGYESSSHFIQTYRKTFGHTPRKGARKESMDY